MERSPEEIAEDKDIIAEVNDLAHSLFHHANDPEIPAPASRHIKLYEDSPHKSWERAWLAAVAAYEHMNPAEDIAAILDRLEDDAQGDPEPDIHRAYKDSTLGL